MARPYYTDPPGEDREAYIVDLFSRLSEDEDPGSSASRFARALRALYGFQGMVSISVRNLKPGHYRIMRFLHQKGVAEKGFTDTFFAGPGAPVQTGGLIAKMIAKDRPTVLRNETIRDDPVLGNQLAPYRLLAFLPVFNAGAVSNWVMLMYTEAKAINDDDIENWMFIANLSGMVTSSKAHSKELREASAWIQREIDEIASIQKGLLPSELPAIPGVGLAALCETFDRAGGDYYDIFPLTIEGDSDPHWVVFVADASGHGPSAAVVVSMVSMLLHSFEGKLDGPATLIDYLNRRLNARRSSFSFVTAFLGILDPRSRRLRYVCAGHPPPILRGVDGEIEHLEMTEGLPLCVSGDARYSERVREMNVGEVLLVYTDGITEAMSPARAQFGETRLEKAYREGGQSASEIRDTIADRVRLHEAGGRPLDDQTMVVIHLTDE